MKYLLTFLIQIFFVSNFFAQRNSAAMIVSEDFVKSVLNYPSTAKFKSFSKVAEPDGYNKYIVWGEVEAKNAFGVSTEMVYKIWLTYKSGDDVEASSWDCPKLILEERYSGKQSVFYPSSKKQSSVSSNKGKTISFLGQSCKVTEEGDAFIRIQTPRKFSKSELEKGVQKLSVSQNIIYFHTSGNSARGKEYASSVNKNVFYY